ncbi:hypothetical protein BSF44_44740 [Pseudomonas sp. ACN8]|jgi:hypothetical protein|uniref:PD-(D/E)XK nuclease domain-containing protein n=1 Tax=Pseudomonas sp. ACN8 TaxID=1920428 RepID=UPI000BB30D6A|nr:PD-(D/E)XK nuclease domain-containing protein [Pseudomonas sp. ACN8]PBJ19641.1 hypothetical protein BSF44_44740 [Pseudomonas sp. ACN8]
MFTDEFEKLLTSAPERNIEIEREIDRKYFLCNDRAESTKVYLDALHQLIDDWNNIRDRRSKSSLVNFITHKSFPFKESNISHLTLLEEDYLRELHRHIANIQMETKNLKHSNSFIYNQIIGEIEKHLLIEIWNSKSIEGKILKLLDRMNDIVYYHSSSPDTVVIHITNLSRTICIANYSFDEIHLPYPATLILNHNDFSKLSKGVLRQANIVELSYKVNSERFEYIDTRDTLDWCTQKVKGAIKSLESTNNTQNGYEIIQDLNDCLSAIESIRFDILDISRLRWDKLRLEDVKRVRTKLSNTVNTLALRKQKETYFVESYQAMISVDRGLRLMFYRITQRLDLDGNILFCLSELKRNNALYALSGNKPKSLDTTFGEENLSAILASNLQCIYRNPHSRIMVRCESRVGNGRSDITIEQERKTISIIESKLIKQKSDITKEITSAINQLFDRYSENQYLDSGRYFQLYVIIFCHDRNLRALDAHISSAIREYSERNGLSWEILESTENLIRFSYIEPKSADMLSDKVRTITLIICNMEVEWKNRAKDRTNLKPYSF